MWQIRHAVCSAQLWHVLHDGNTDVNLALQPGHFDDRLGPLGLCVAVVLALSAILVVSIIDFVEAMKSRGDGDGGGDAPSPSPAGPSPALSSLLEASRLLGAMGMRQASSS